MNIANALNAALPELPERVIKRGVPKLDPRVIAKQQIEGGKPTVLAKLPGSETFIRLEPPQWALVRLFDGERSYLQISELASAQTGTPYSEDTVREIADFINRNTDLFYRSPLEKNISLYQKLKEQRLKRKKAIDFSDIILAEWPQADNYITHIYPWFRWIYTWWFTLLALAMFATMCWMWSSRFMEIWNDSFEYFDFTSKTTYDLIEFWFLFGGMAFFHESFHGLTCKHFGGNVEKMGFSLMYFAPSFFCDITQAWIYGGKWERIATAIAGIWGDLILCFLATVVWWSTTPGMLTHNLAYKVMAVTGLGVSILNLNPLIKLDGYFIFCELIGQPEFKERTSAYFSSWTRKNLLRMPAEVEYIPRWQRPLFLLYAVLSGLYGYLLLSFLMVLAYNVLHAYSPAWAFVPAVLAGYWVFRERIHSFARLSKLVYLDKRERIWGGLVRLRVLGVGAALLLLLFFPVWPDLQDASFVLEAAKEALVHAPVRGRVSKVLVDEGQRVAAGQLLVTLENLDLQSELARVRAELQMATARATQNQLRYGDYGSAEQERQRLLHENRFLADETARLQITSPIAGLVASPRPSDLQGADLDEGAPLVELIDDSALRARVFVPEFAMHDVHPGSRLRMHIGSRIVPMSGAISAISPDWVALDPSLGEKEQLAGINPPRFFAAEVWLPAAADLRPGMTGTAKIQVGRRSLAYLLLRFGRDLVGRRIW